VIAVPYEELTRGNEGFVTRSEQSALHWSRVFVCGLGGSGGAAVQSLVRAGVGGFGIADGSRFRTSSMNGHVFATGWTLGRTRAGATREALLDINPRARVETFETGWPQALDEILPRHDVVVNGLDDLPETLILYRKAREWGVTVVDSYASSLPSVTVVRPEDPRPEERLDLRTAGHPPQELSPEQRREATLREMAYAAAVAPVIERFDPTVLGAILTGRREASSFAPAVITTGNLMAMEALNVLLERPSGAGCGGYFLDLWTGRVHRPGPDRLVRRRSEAARGVLLRLREAADAGGPPEEGTEPANV